MKKTNKKEETIEEKFAEEEAESREQLAQFIKDNPGATLNELSDIWTGYGSYEFLKAMLALFDEHKVVEDVGCYFPDDATREKMEKEDLY